MFVLLIGAILVGLQGIAPGQPSPIFHAEAYVVTTFIAFIEPDGKFRLGMTSDDVQATINKKPVALSISEDPRQPGHYVLSINPPSELRDGKSHRIDVKVRHGDKWSTLPIKWMAIFEKPEHLGLGSG